MTATNQSSIDMAVNCSTSEVRRIDNLENNKNKILSDEFDDVVREMVSDNPFYEQILQSGLDFDEVDSLPCQSYDARYATGQVSRPLDSDNQVIHNEESARVLGDMIALMNSRDPDEALSDYSMGSEPYGRLSTISEDSRDDELEVGVMPKAQRLDSAVIRRNALEPLRTKFALDMVSPDYVLMFSVLRKDRGRPRASLLDVAGGRSAKFNPDLMGDSDFMGYRSLIRNILSYFSADRIYPLALLALVGDKNVAAEYVATVLSGSKFRKIGWWKIFIKWIRAVAIARLPWLNDFLALTGASPGLVEGVRIKLRALCFQHRYDSELESADLLEMATWSGSSLRSAEGRYDVFLPFQRMWRLNLRTRLRRDAKAQAGAAYLGVLEFAKNTIMLENCVWCFTHGQRFRAYAMVFAMMVGIPHSITVAKLVYSAVGQAKQNWPLWDSQFADVDRSIRYPFNPKRGQTPNPAQANNHPWLRYEYDEFRSVFGTPNYDHPADDGGSDDLEFDQASDLEAEQQWDRENGWGAEHPFEEEEKSPDPPFVLRSAEADNYFQQFAKSPLWTKFLAMLSSMSIPEFASTMPSVVNKAIESLVSGASILGSHNSVFASVLSFLSTFQTKMGAFLESWDWREFLKDGGKDTWAVRAQTLCSYDPSRTSKVYSTINEALNVMDETIAEGNNYCQADPKRWTPHHENVFRLLLGVRDRLRVSFENAGKRDRQPFSYIVTGAAGAAKTTNGTEFNHWVVQQDKTRPIGKNGKRIVQGTDFFTAPLRFKHWTGCKAPVTLCLNDIPADGYDPQVCNIPETLRLAVDVEPFSTPQAEITDKLYNTIDPKVVMVTTNAMKWAFSLKFGTDWQKLVRRYPNVYYVAMPVEFYERDIEPTGNDHGKLKKEYEKRTVDSVTVDRLRYYECSIDHRGGDIHFSRTRFLGLGKDAFMLDLKKRYLAHLNEEPYNFGDVKTCCQGTSWDWHATQGECLPGCDYNTSSLEVASDPVVLQRAEGGSCTKAGKTVSKVHEKMTIRATSVVMNHYKKEALAEFERVKQKMTVYTLWLAASAAALAAAACLVTNARRPDVAVNKKPERVVVTEKVLNPLDQSLDPDVIERYGIAKGIKMEVKNPPKYATQPVIKGFMSKVSATTNFDELQKRVENNTVIFDCGDMWGYGLYISSNLCLMNYHVYATFPPGVEWVMRTTVANDRQLRFLSPTVAEYPLGDLVLVHTPTTNCQDITKHFVTEIGRQVDVSLAGSLLVKADISLGCLEEVLPHCTEDLECVCYDVVTDFGDCGKPCVANVRGKGMILGIHVGRGFHNRGVSLIVSHKRIMTMCNALGVSPSGVVTMPFADNVKDLYGKSVFLVAEGVSMLALGSFEQKNKPSRSRLIRTPLHDKAVSLMKVPKTIPMLEEDGRLIDGEWYAPYRHKFKGLAYQPCYGHIGGLKAACVDYLSGAPIAALTPLGLDEAICGVEGNPFLKKMNFNTSSGVYQRFGLSKKDLLDLEHVNADLKRAVVEYLRILEDNCVAEHQKWSLKDEAVTFAKELVKKYRYFAVSDLLNLIAFRMFLAPLVAHMYQHKDFFECYGAFNPASRDFGVMYDEMRKFPLLILADIKHMDSSHRSLVIDMVAEVFAFLAAQSGYNATSVKIVRNLVRSIVFSLVELNGDLVFMMQGMGSGVYVTFIVNCIVLSLLYRVSWLKLGNREPFRKCNVLRTGGDDSALSTMWEGFDAISISKVFAAYGYEMSPATDKSSEQLPFDAWADFVFLQRSPNQLVVKGMAITVGALNPDSIYKSLAFELPSTSISSHDRLAQVVDAARREMALHGKSKLAELDTWVPQNLPIKYLSYEEILDKYQSDCLYDNMSLITDSLVFEGVAQSSSQGKSDGNITKEHSRPQPHVVRSSVMLSLAVAGIYLWLACVAMWTAPYEGKALRTRKTNALSNSKHNNMSTASDSQEAPIIGSDAVTNSQEGITNFSLTSQVVSSVTPMYVTPDYASGGQNVDIAKVLERPVFIDDFVWTAASADQSSFSQLYVAWQANTMVQSKLRGYKFWRGQPRLRVVVNGASTYYGKLVVCVDMTPGDDGYAGSSSMTTNATPLLSVSQALTSPHISIDPSLSATYDLSIPWYSTTGWYNRMRSGINPSALVKIFVMNTLRSATATAPVGVDMKFYLIMDNMELAVPSVGPLESAKGGKVKTKAVTPEEKKGGTLSGALFAASNMASVVGGAVPVLDEFTLPFEVAANTLGTVASWFGFSRPNMPMEEQQVRANNHPAYMAGQVSTLKLTGDPNQNVAVGAKASGVGADDDMLISKIIMTNGYKSTATWTTGAGFADSHEVTPMVKVEDSRLAVGHTLYMPLGYVSRPFTYWSGDIVFHIEVVASAYHRGALTVSWVPYEDAPPPGLRYDYSNAFQTMVLDLSKSRSVDFIVPFGGDANNLFVHEGYGSRANGILYISELNTIQSGDTSTIVDINVYMRAGENFHLYRPDQSYISFVKPYLLSAESARFRLKSAESAKESEMVLKADVFEEGAAPAMDTVTDGMEVSRTKIFFGEEFTSLKQLFARMAVNVIFTDIVGTIDESNTLSYHALPVDSLQTTDAYDQCLVLTDFMAYFNSCFLATRGGQRFLITRMQSKSARATEFDSCNYMVSIGPSAATTYYQARTLTFDEDPTAVLGRLVAQQGSGGLMAKAVTNNGVEFEVPDMHRYRFRNPRKYGGWAAAPDPTFPSVAMISPTEEVTSVVAYRPHRFVYKSGAEDYVLHHFMFVPIVTGVGD